MSGGDDAVVRVAEVSKSYRIFERPEDRLKQVLFGRFRTFYRDFWAVRNVSFEVRRGESLAIIGRNGSGKSTLLEMITGTVRPTRGTIQVRGRTAALLELGAGFNPEFTGRENVRMNGALLGMTRVEVEEKMATILDFAEIQDFADRPVKTYSSGMFVRLAFAVQIHTNPDVLIVDEALSVGDVFFQQKCFDRMDALMKGGTTLLFVSHDLGSVLRLCHRAILLKAGSVDFDGPAQEAVNRYYRTSEPTRRRAGASLAATTADASGADAQLAAQAVRAHDLSGEAKSRHGTRTLEILAIALLGPDNNPKRAFEIGDVMRVAMLIRAGADVHHPQAGINLYDRFGTLVFAGGNHNLGVDIGPFTEGTVHLYEFDVTLDVQQGVYTFSAIVSEEAVDGPNAGTFYDVLEGLGPVEVSFRPGRLLPFFGIARLPTRVAGSYRIS